MKKSILSIAIAIAAFSSALAAAPTKVNQRAIASFQQEFKNASNVEWTASDKLVQATFRLDNKTMFAYYNIEGNLVGVVNHILTSQLPADLQNDIKKDYSNYWVSELFEVSSDQGTHYYIQLKNADQTIVLSTEGSSNWHTYASK